MNANLVLLKKDGSRKSFSLAASTVIGRERRCNLFIPLASVSRKHCKLLCDRGRWIIRDLGSRNGTILNENRIDESDIKPGDSIKIGPLKFVFEFSEQPADAGRTEPVSDTILQDDMSESSIPADDIIALPSNDVPRS